VLSVALASGASGATTTFANRPPVKSSPPGQISIAAVNARQNEILGLKLFEALIGLARAFRFRPLAFNGGTQGAVIAPDVAVITEFRETNLEVFGKLMRERFDEPYEIIGPPDVQGAFVVNTRTVELQGNVQLVDDVCLNDEASDKPRLNRQYPMARFKEVSTGSIFTLIGIHLSRDYSVSGISDCLVKNVEEVRAQLEHEPGAAFAAGDFNFRPTIQPYECDPYEQGEPARWWSLLTAPADGDRPYEDAVQSFHRARSLSMLDEWTYQHPARVTTCNGTEGVRRSRIDYIFASGAQVAEAHADHPGWLDPDNFQYSDHRYVLGRFVLSGPPRPLRPAAAQEQGGVIAVTWQAVEGATGWVLYRAKAGYDYKAIAELTGEVTSYEDADTVNDETYRYAVAPVGVDSGQGIESAPIWATADSRGPHVTGIVPGPGATGISPFVTIRASFDEFVDAASVNDQTISIYRNGQRIPGRLVRKGGFVLKFNPTFTLKKGETFTVVVRPVTDVLGNAGPVFRSRFSTVEPPKKHRHHRR
jgi:endonuclease/exonuclease/phosphatase family metal-dependent hydrolase